VDNVIDDFKVRPGGVDAVLLVALFIIGLETIVGNDVLLDADVMSISQDPLVGVVVDEIAFQVDVVGVVEFDPIPAIPDFEAFDSDPSDRLLPALL
jgi:hypothetical protein